MAFSQDCKLGDKGPTFCDTLTFCISMYGESDDENITNIELANLKPWDAETYKEIDIQKKLITKVYKDWKLLEILLYTGIDTLTLEYLLCDMRIPFEDEAYKILEIALNTNNVELFDWVKSKYKLDWKRVKSIIKIFVPNDVTTVIRNISF